MSDPLYGVIPPMITPFDESGELDERSLTKIVDFLCEHVDGLFVCGSYGAGPLMSTAERKRVAAHTIERAAGRVRTVIHVGTTATREALELARHAEQAGADAVSAVGPFYYSHGADALIGFYSALVGAVDIPVYVYNNPKFQGYEMSLDLLSRLKDAGVRGIKDATFDILLHSHYQRLLADERFDIALGTEALWLPARAVGCQAFIPGLGNAFPELCHQLHREGMEGRPEECRATQFRVNALREVMYLARSTQLAVYAMLDILGIARCYPRAPFVPATAEEQTALRAALQNLSLAP